MADLPVVGGPSSGVRFGGTEELDALEEGCSKFKWACLRKIGCVKEKKHGSHSKKDSAVARSSACCRFTMPDAWGGKEYKIGEGCRASCLECEPPDELERLCDDEV